jgi:DHA2 family multidrug resistance protein
VPNVVFVGAAVCLLVRNFPNVLVPHDPRVKGVDKLGIGLLGIALVSMQVLLSRGEIDDWFGSPTIQALAWVTAFALLLFIVWQMSPRNELRLMRLDLVRDRHVMASICLGVFAGVILSGSIYALPEFLRHVDPRELNATRTGQIMCAYSFTAALIRPLVTKSIAKFGQRKALVFSLTMLIVSMLLMARLITLGTPEWMYAVPLVLYAFCLAPLLSAIGGGTVARLAQEVQLDAVSIYMTFRQFGASLGVTLVSVALDWREDLHSSRLFEHLHESNSPLRHWTDIVARAIAERGGLSNVQTQEMAKKLLEEAGARQAAALAYADAFVFMAAIGVVALCLVPIMSPTPVVKK